MLTFIESFTLHTTHLIYTYHSLKLGCTHSHSILYIMIEIVISERYKLSNSNQVKHILGYVSHYMHKTENQFHEANALHSKHKNYGKMILDYMYSHNLKNRLKMYMIRTKCFTHDQIISTQIKP